MVLFQSIRFSCKIITEIFVFLLLFSLTINLNLGKRLVDPQIDVTVVFVVIFIFNSRPPCSWCSLSCFCSVQKKNPWFGLPSPLPPTPTPAIPRHQNRRTEHAIKWASVSLWQWFKPRPQRSIYEWVVAENTLRTLRDDSEGRHGWTHHLLGHVMKDPGPVIGK